MWRQLRWIIEWELDWRDEACVGLNLWRGRKHGTFSWGRFTWAMVCGVIRSQRWSLSCCGNLKSSYMSLIFKGFNIIIKIFLQNLLWKLLIKNRSSKEEDNFLYHWPYLFKLVLTIFFISAASSRQKFLNATHKRKLRMRSTYIEGGDIWINIIFGWGMHIKGCMNLRGSYRFPWFFFLHFFFSPSS